MNFGVNVFQLLGQFGRANPNSEYVDKHAREFEARSGSYGRGAPAAGEASHASGERHARSEATRFVTGD